MRGKLNQRTRPDVRVSYPENPREHSQRGACHAHHRLGLTPDHTPHISPQKATERGVPCAPPAGADPRPHTTHLATEGYREERAMRTTGWG